MVLVGIIGYTDILFSVTFLFRLLFLIGVLAASYAGTTLALKRFFADESQERPKNEYH